MPDAVARVRRDVGAVEAVAQAQLGLMGKRVIGSHQDMDPLGYVLDHFEVHEVDRLEHQREVGGIGGEFFLGLGAVAHVHGKGHPRVLGPVARDLLRQEVGQQRLAAGDADVAPAFSGQVGDLALDLGEVGLGEAVVLEQELSGGVQPHAAREPLEEFGAEFLLESADAPVQRRGGQVHILRRLPHGAGAGHRLDQREGIQVPHFNNFPKGVAFFAPHM